MRRLRQVRKRDGRLVPFRREKIAEAIFRAARAVGGEDRFLAQELAAVVALQLERQGGAVPTIEEIQDAVEKVLIETGHARTAKAYILYRERRAAARAVGGLAGVVRPLVGGEAGEEPEAFSKARLADALVAADALEPEEAEEIARAVEERLLRIGRLRIAEELLTAVVAAECLERGRETRLLETAARGVHPPLTALLRVGPEDGRRAPDPLALEAAAGEAAWTAHLLCEVLPTPVAEAHRQGDLHLYDLGAPLRLSAIAAPLAPLLEDLGGEDLPRDRGPRRVASWLGEVLRRHGAFAARWFALEDLNVVLAPFLAHLDEEALGEEVREILLLPPVLEFPARGGLLQLEWVLAGEVPARWAPVPVPPPAGPGRTFGDHAEAALRVARCLLREATALRRAGQARGPRLTLLLPRGRARDAAARSLVRQALAAAAEVGEPRVVFQESDVPTRGSRWLRLREDEVVDPTRFARGDVTVATAAAVDLVAAALRAGRGQVDAFLADLDRLVRAAFEGAAARRALLERAASGPGDTLWPLRRGPVPLVDLDGAWHLLEAVGLEQASRLLEPGGAQRGRILRHLQERVLAEAASHGLLGGVTEGLTGEAAARMARLDARRFDAAARWWQGGQAASYATPPPPPGEARREAAWPDRRRRGPDLLRVRHRVDGERRPAVDDLLGALEAASQDPSVVEYALEPWPRRHLRGS